MNLAEALIEVPELPSTAIAKRKLKLNPDLVVREEVDENGNPISVAFVPEESCVYRIPQGQFELLKLFDGERSFAEIAEVYQQMGGDLTEEDVKRFAASAQDTGLWYVSPQERNITLSQKLAEDRRKRVRRKSKHGDVAHMKFKWWDPDEFLTRLNQRVSFVFTWWFTAITLVLFGFMTWIWIDRWSEIGRDTIRYYTFTNKNGWDLLEFWVLFLVMAFLHETAHGLTCKHYGGNVHDIGFQLIYLAPAFAADITEVWVRTGKWQRIAAIMAGIWVETVVCALATFVWWGTPTGSYSHELAYKFMLITGVMVVVMNLNPLIKLDGYYALGELTGIQELKEKSTAFLSGWVKRHVFRLPVEYDYVPLRRRLLYVPYAFLSGAYSYLLLFAVARFANNIFRSYSPEWAFIPASYLAWKIFRSRIKRLWTFMKTVYLNVRSKIAITRTRLILAAGIGLVVLFAPLFRQTVTAPLILEPTAESEIHARVPGVIQAVLADEGAHVKRDALLMQLENPGLERDLANAEWMLEIARDRRTKAQLMYASLGEAQAQFEKARILRDTAQRKASLLLVRAPIEGTLTTARVGDLVGQYVSEGTLLAKLENTSTLRVRLFVPEFEMRNVRPGSRVAVHLLPGVGSRKATVEEIAIAPAPISEGLMPPSQYQGLKGVNYYAVTATIVNDGTLKPGMSGLGKILVRHHSLAAIITQEAVEFVLRRAW